jgi:adhesin transport system membrane fusion protein
MANTFFSDYDYEGLSKKSHKAHFLLWIIVIFMLIMLAWSYFAVLDEVTVADGKVIPSQRVQIIDNLEGGFVKKLYVNEGDTVKKGQLLIQLDDVKFKSIFRESKIKMLALQLKVKRLQAEIDNKKFEIPTEIMTEFPDLVKHEQDLYKSNNLELSTLISKRDVIQQQMALTRKAISSGAASKFELLQLQQALEEINNTISKFKSSLLQDLNATSAEVSRINENIVGLQDQLTRTGIQSPVRGIVKQIYANTTGGVVKPGSPIMEIVPLDDTLLIEARVKPKDVGFLRPKQEATVKVSAYDFSIYGGLKGRLETISADTSTDEKGNSYYEIEVRTNKNYLEKDGKKFEIIPGMQVSVDILTGKKTVLNYLLKPILKAKQKALRER